MLPLLLIEKVVLQVYGPDNLVISVGVVLKNLLCIPPGYD